MDDAKLHDPLLTDEERRARTSKLAKKLFEALGDRNYNQEKTFRDRDEAQRESLLTRALAPFRGAVERFKEECKEATFPMKAGLAAGICSILCFLPGPLSFLNKNAMWAVVTADLVLEANVGLTFSKGINRTLGTLAAAALAFLVNYLAPRFGKFEHYFVGLWVFLGAFVATMFKFRRPFKDRWNYAVAMSMVTFHILILSASTYSDKLKLPMIRLVDIVIGFLIASLVNMVVVPHYAADTMNELVASNFERAGNVMERCVIAYCSGLVLDQVPEIIAGRAGDDNIHMAFHEIVASDSEVEKLMKAVPFEPCHGKFFWGYPWDMYHDITHNLRYTLYDVVALDSCLRAEIQSPRHLRHLFESEFQCIGKECAQVFRLIGSSIREMRHVKFGQNMHVAEEGALLLQHKIAKYTSSLLSGYCETDALLDKVEAMDKHDDDDDEYPRDENLTYATSHSIRSDRTSKPRDDNDSPDSSKHKDGQHPKLLNQRLQEGHEDLFRRSPSMSQHWDTTVQRISALSLIKFASLLIELVAKAKYVVSIVDELEIKARFDEEDEEYEPSIKEYPQV